MGQRIVVVVRPQASAEEIDRLRASVKGLREAGHELLVRLTFEEGDGEAFARQAAAGGADVVVAAGGDGTINEVVNGLGGTEHRPRFAVVPLGTANDFAMGLGVPADIEAAMSIAVGGAAIPIDLPLVNDRYFVNVSTGGFGAEATEHAAPESKRLLGGWAYVVTGARQFSDLRPVTGTFEAEGEVLFELDFLLFAVGNGKQTGGGSMLTPRAELADGRLDLLVVRSVPRLDFLSLLPDLRAGTHLESPDIAYAQATSFVVSTDQTLSVNADGEPFRGSRFEYRLDPQPLVVMVARR